MIMSVLTPLIILSLDRRIGPTTSHVVGISAKEAADIDTSLVSEGGVMDGGRELRGAVAKEGDQTGRILIKENHIANM